MSGQPRRRTRRLLLRPFLLLATAVVAIAPGQAQETPEAQLDRFVDEFIETDRADRAATLSAASFQDRIERIDGWLADLEAIDRDGLGVQDDIDWRFARSILMGRKIDLEEIRSWRRDPRDYMRFRGLNMILGRPGDPAAKADEVIDALELIAVQLGHGEENLTVHVPRFHELSVFMAEGARDIFGTQVPELARQAPERADEILAANDSAAAALESFIEFLHEELPTRTEGTYAIGEETYDRMLRHQYLLDYDSAGLYEYARGQYDETVGELESLAGEIEPGTPWRQLADEIKHDYPDPHRMIEAHQEWVDRAGEHVREHDLVPISWEETVNVVPRAEYRRKTSYYGNFSRARKNDEGVWVAEWQINPFEDQWDEETKQEYLVEHDWGVIIVTAPHETYAGHHIQGLYQMHNPRDLRREYGISIFSEGWGLYNEELMQETGFFPGERIHLRQLQLRLWRNARVVWDVGMHTGRMTYDEAVSLLADGVGFLRWAADLEVAGSARRPGYRIGYFMGMSEIMEMREEYGRRVGEEFTLRDFHERLLKVGNMPPALMRAGLMASLDESRGTAGPDRGAAGADPPAWRVAEGRLAEAANGRRVPTE